MQAHRGRPRGGQPSLFFGLNGKLAVAPQRGVHGQIEWNDHARSVKLGLLGRKIDAHPVTFQFAVVRRLALSELVPRTRLRIAVVLTAMLPAAWECGRSLLGRAGTARAILRSVPTASSESLDEQ